MKNLSEMRSSRSAARRPPRQKSEPPGVHPPSEELIQQQQRAMWQSFYNQNGQRRAPMPSYPSWGAGGGGAQMLPGHSIQGNSVLHHSQIHAHSEVVTHMPDYFRQRVHYAVPGDQHLSRRVPWQYDPGEVGGNAQVMVPYPQQYEQPSWSTLGAYHPYPWPYGDTTPPPTVYPPTFVPPPPPTPVPSFFPRHLPPQLPFLQVAHLHGNHRYKQPNLSLVRLAQEAREKVARDPRDRIRAGPSGSNLTAANIDMQLDRDDIAYSWRQDPTAQLGTLYHNSSANVGHMPDGDAVKETRTHAETPRNTTADETDKM